MFWMFELPSVPNFSLNEQFNLAPGNFIARSYIYIYIYIYISTLENKRPHHYLQRLTFTVDDIEANFKVSSA